MKQQAELGRFKKLTLCSALGGVVATLSLVGSETAQAEDNENSKNENSKSVIEELVITAQKREQNIQDVGISVTVFGSSELQRLGSKTPGDLAAYTPNLNYKNATGSSNAVFTLRGASVSTFASNAINSVGVYVDEVYLPSSIQTTFALFDIDRVEVLRGPQGTLFGRNSTGGALSFVTKRPSATPDNHLRVGVGSYETFEVDGGFNFSLTEELHGRIAFKQETQNEGFFFNRRTNNDVGDKNRFSGRFSLVWSNDTTTIDFNLHGGRDDSEYQPWQGVGALDANEALTSSPFGGFPAGSGFRLDDFGGASRLCGSINDAQGTTGQGNIANVFGDASCVDAGGFRDPDGNDPFSGEFSADLRSSSDTVGAILKVATSFDDLDFVSITGYDVIERDANDDFDGGPFQIGDIHYVNDISTFQQEFRLSGANDTVNWVTGLFYSTDENKTDTEYLHQQRFGTNLLVSFDQKTDVFAAFANAGWALSPTLTLNTGVRYTDEETNWDGSTAAFDVLPGGADVFGTVTAPGVLDSFNDFYNFANGRAANNETISDSEATYKLGLDYKTDGGTLLYGHASTGFKSGGFNGTWATSSGEVQPFGAETVDSYELGFKSTLLDESLLFNGAFYSVEYSDIQLFGTNNQTGAFGVTNAGGAEVKGVELEVWWKPTDRLDIKGGLGLTDSEVVDSRTSAAPNGARLPNTSEVSFNAIVSYVIPVGGGDTPMTLTPIFSTSFTGDQFFQPNNFNVATQDDYWVHNLSVRLEPESGEWAVSGWVKNLSDEVYFTESFLSTSAGVVGRLVGAPRTVGVDFTYYFND